MLRYIFCFLISLQLFSQVNIISSCSDNEVGVSINVYTTDQFIWGNYPEGLISWNITDSQDSIIVTNSNPYAPYFLYESDEICLNQGESYSFNTFDLDGDGWGTESFYSLSLCGGNNVIINNNGNTPFGSQTSENFDLPLINDNCFCFSAELFGNASSSISSADGSIDITTFGGNPPFFYQWSNGDTTGNLNNAIPGLYFLTVTDSLGCQLTLSGEVQGPNVYMNNQDVVACTGYFYDSGGSTGNFSGSENYQMTICSNESDLYTSLDFSFFDLGGNFFSSPNLIIYDGNSTNELILYSYLGPGDSPPGNIIASENNSSGCLTIVFSSPGSPNSLGDQGWAAEINCQYPCQDFEVEIQSSDWINAQGEIDACHDIDLNAITNFSNNNLFYNQSNENTLFEWSFGDSQEASNQYVNHLYSDLGSYNLSLVATDVNGCQSETSLTVVNDQPGIDINITSPSETLVCPGTELEIESNSSDDSLATSFFQSVTWILYEDALNVGEDFGDAIYLPDGSGVSYSTEINVTSFDPLAVLDDDDFVDICIEIEHSYLGDLELELTAPGGQNVILHSYGSGGGNTWLGNALDNNSEEVPGDCWEYCWSAEPVFGTFGSSLGNTMSAPNGGNAMIPGYYAPEQSFSNFSGSPANGNWTLIITDNLSIDNGFICSWYLSMNVVGEQDEIISDSLVSEVLNYNWYCPEEPSSIISYDSTSLIIQPLNSGIHTYQMTIFDNFGCEYIEQFEIDVYSAPDLPLNLISECQSQLELSVSNVSSGGGFWELIDAPPESTLSFDPDSNSLNPVINVSDPGLYLLSFTDNDCKITETTSVNFSTVKPIIEASDNNYCFLNGDVSVVNQNNISGNWSYFNQNQNNLIFDDSLSGSTNIEVSDFDTYDVSFTFDFCKGSDTVEINFLKIDPVIFDPGVQVCEKNVVLEVENLSTTGGYWDIISPPEHGYGQFSNNTGQLTDLQVNLFGDYNISYTINGCETKDSLMVKFGQGIPQIFFDDYVRCETSTSIYVESYGMDLGWEYLNGPGNAIFNDNFSFENQIDVDNYGYYTFSYSGCDTTVKFSILFICDIEIPNVFSPNDDGFNDYFIINGLTNEFYSQSNLSIYNRWGDEVYKNGYYGLDGLWWDGKNNHYNDEKLTQGVYFYVLKVANRVNLNEEIYKGTLHLLK
ncbi:MAG: PKD domain-containing protein [Flavobacteriales bacterium TMED288]|nr:hypothetical protein [Flavobacteriales bacterium]RPG53847.1 MAG: PKD domain-containing protein [Flavobacteriales bacterium TMED288]|tara:strand:+ start:3223 stop:6726 length:3504 start_codon:yes stop_codon:yes gene_type:complete